MAGDWIKMRTDLYRHPKVCLIADALLDADGPLARYVSQNCRRDMAVTRNVTRNVTVGALVTVWGVTRHRGERVDDDLLLRNSTLSVIDDISELPGFGDAMATVGWAVESDEGVIFPRFFAELNVEPAADKRSQAAERQRRYREKRNAKGDALRNVTVTSQSNARERIEREKSNTPPISPKGDSSTVLELPPSIDTPEFRERLNQWLTYRGPKAYKPQGMAAMVSRAATLATEHGLPAVCAAIERAMANGWKGWDQPNAFEVPKGGKPAFPKPPPPNPPVPKRIPPTSFK